MKSLAMVTAIVIVLSPHAVLAKGAPVVRVEGKPVEYLDVAQGIARFQDEQHSARFRAARHFAHPYGELQLGADRLSSGRF